MTDRNRNVLIKQQPSMVFMVSAIVLSFLAIIIIGLLVLFVLMASWNLTMPHLFGLPEIDFVQTSAIVLMATFIKWVLTPFRK